MRKIFFIGIMIFLTTGGLAQQASGLIDSLKLELARLSELENKEKELTSVLLKLCYHQLANPIESYQYGQLALEIAKANHIKEYEAYANYYLSRSEKLLGNNLQSIDLAIRSAQLFHELDKPYEESYALIRIGNIFSSEGDIINALIYFKQALQIFEGINDRVNIGAIQTNIGETFRKLGQTDSALYYYNLSLYNIKAESNSNDQNMIAVNEATTLGNIGMVYLEMGEYELARDYISRADAFFTDKDDPYRKSVYQCELGKLAILEGNIDEGEALINQSLQMAQHSQLKEQIRDFSLELSKFYEQQKLPVKALAFHKQYKYYDDSLKNIENVRRLEQQQSQFQLSRKDEEITTLNKINKLQRLLSLLLLGGTLVVVIFTFLSIRTNLKIKKFNREITLQKQLVEEREKEKALLLKELNHRVKNNLQMVASLLSLHSRQLKGHPAAEALMAGKYRVEALTLIHQKLYRDDVDTKIDLKDYIDELAKNLVMNFNQDFRLELNLESFTMKIDKAIPLGLILNELITNSLKYGKPHDKAPVLSIAVKKKEREIELFIEDNGPGLPDDFDFRNAKSFGLKLVHSLVQQLGGTITWNSEQGTIWKLTLAIAKIS
ncbi:MAG: tetratricopeptide repeat protein [Prolixibacteraceae bacterium]|nr:tetratricopeptide repeat protein [Prolixibacteraceae bacterium]